MMSSLPIASPTLAKTVPLYLCGGVGEEAGKVNSNSEFQLLGLPASDDSAVHVIQFTFADRVVEPLVDVQSAFAVTHRERAPPPLLTALVLCVSRDECDALCMSCQLATRRQI